MTDAKNGWNFSLVALVASAPVLAHGGRDDDRERGWRHGHDKHWHHKHWRGHHEEPRHVVRERVIVHERPVFVERRVIYALEPHPVYMPRDPAVVVRVDIPPLVFPLR